ncbi:Arylsulfatase precursor [Thalassoglobus neptunius]|uniref:Arylsulfatase n=1 Tax=Thalassoglobus neptunius TaxID=1938619 RepID=A0A5C5VS90_9PLAN|nr:arylsulfatase [Thalassoglobus neptunius]TWT41474.1 Arylsulfatase precursor [Thalassoglobus neptunius]
MRDFPTSSATDWKSTFRSCLNSISAVFIGLVLFTVEAYSEELNASSAVQSRPNVILILADDMALGDLSCLNENRTKTPNLDRLKEESVWFSQAYSGSPVCASARAALLTGRYPHRTGVVTLNMVKYPELTRLRLDETTMADVFRQSGYRTALIGKWHLGLGSEYHPLNRGFDVFEGFSGHLYVSDYFNYKLQIQNETEHFEDRYLTDDFTDRAIDFVTRNAERPFFLHLAHYAPHRPLGAPEEKIEYFTKKGFDQQTATVYAMIEVLDDGIGRLLDQLDTLGIRDQTLILFASDNGPDPVIAERFNLNLRGTKYMVSEGGIHVPLMVNWEKTFAPHVIDRPVHFTDVLPTLIEVCHLDDTPTNRLDGVSFASSLTSETRAERNSPMFWQWNRTKPRYSHNASIREGNWKLVRPFVTRNVPKRDSSEPAELFNLEKDPFESNDLSASEPELTKRLLQQLQDWSDDVESSRTRPQTDSSKSSLPQN